MTRTIQTLAVRSLSRIVVTVLAAGTLLLAADTVDAALTTNACLAQKQTAWGTLRKCQATERAKALKGKTADLAKCQSKFQEKLAKISAKAAKVKVACRYRANGDGTATDYDTGLQWETKDGEVGGICFVVVDRVNHCVNSLYDWLDAHTFVESLNGSSPDALVLTDPFAGHSDWRVPTIIELGTILDQTVPGCGSGGVCIDAVFGPTALDNYWSSTTRHDSPVVAFQVYFSEGGGLNAGNKGTGRPVRVVRTQL